jgi:hypothetical protein
VTTASTATRRREHRPLVLTSAGAAVAASAGAIGLLTGAVDFGSELNARLPFGSPRFAGLALLVVVAIPMSVVAGLESRRDDRASNAAIVAGALLIGWIAAQLFVLQSFSWLQPACAALGAAVVMLGVAQRKERRCL